MAILLRNRGHRWAGLAGGLLVLLVLSGLSVAYGTVPTGWRTVVQAYTRFDGSDVHLIITTVRVPRTLLALVVGASLGIAGLLLQLLTRNPLADVEVMGINGGAALAVVVAATVFGASSLTLFTYLACLGAALAGVTAYVLGSLGREGPTPLKLTLAGAAVWALCESLTSGFLTANERALEEVLFWLRGSVAGRQLEGFLPLIPGMAAGWLAAWWVAEPLRTLLLGDDVARGLGQHTLRVKLAAGAAAIVLAGTSVAAAGPIGFVGLVAPHLARALVGLEARWLVAYSGLLGAVLLLAADMGGRFLTMPEEVPLGVMTAVLGAPVFVVLGRRELR